jgi:hypothetical protein
MANALEAIRLNFYPILPQEFGFKVWRKKYQGEKKEGTFESLHRNSLPIRSGSNDRDDYWISFSPVPDFQEFFCIQSDNHRLTKHYLFHLLLFKTQQALAPQEYIITETKFRKQLSFVLEEHREGKQIVWLEPYYLKLDSGGKFGFLLDFKFAKNPRVLFSRRVQQLSLSLDQKYRSNRNYYIDKYQKLKFFSSKYKSRIFPLITDSSKIDLADSMQDIPTKKLRTKKYVFAHGRTGTSQYKGIEINGPLKKLQNDVILTFIYREKDRYFAADLLNALKGNFRDVAFKGMERIFDLTVKRVEKFPITAISEEQLQKAVTRVATLNAETNDALLMPVFITDKEDDRAYYFMKYELLRRNLPLQVVTYQLLGRKDALKWSASNIALQIFAKLGGKPWKVMPSHEKTLIFGIGQSHQKADEKIVKYFAYSVCTDSSGLYKKISVLGESENENAYLKQLKDNILMTIQEHIHNGYNKYVLHIPFKIKRKELDNISEAISSLAEQQSQPDNEFVVLRVEPKNKYFGYAYTNSLIPYESTYLKLSYNPRSYLIWFEGLQYHKEAIYKRIPGPMYVEFHWSNKQLEEAERIKYLQDVLNLSGANWRGFNAKNLPISIYYCQLIAGFLKQFPDEIENLDRISNPWFL